MQGGTPRDTSIYARTEGLIDRGELKLARSLLEDHLQSNRGDSRALTLLGRVYLNWPVVGRWEALRLLRVAMDVEPGDPDPWYWKMRVGKFLGSADGEALMRSGIRGVLERNPAHRDVWTYWNDVYHNAGHLRTVAEILADHAGNPEADLRRAILLTEAEEYGSADTVLARLIAEGRDDGTVWAIRAQSALEAGDTANGFTYYDMALRRAATDSLEILWQQVAPIAWEEEDSLWSITPAQGREAFLRGMWARREPDVTTLHNERIVEHFQRMRHARENYRLLNPLSRFHYSPERRAYVALGQERWVTEEAIRLGPIAGRSRLEDAVQQAGLGVGLMSVPEPDSITRYRKFGLDGRGLIYMRFGEPDRRLTSNRGVEAWDYKFGDGYARITIARATTAGGGDMVLFPTSRAELANTITMLGSDATSLDSDLAVEAWVAFFRGALEGEQLVYVGVNGDSSGVAVWDDQWVERQRVRGPSPHVLPLRRGYYALGIDRRDGDRRGRLRTEVNVPTLWRGSLALSSLLIGLSEDTAYGRDEIARTMPANRRYPAGTPLALYTEIYGLSANDDGMSYYGVTYAFEPERGGRLVSLSFDRVVEAQEAIRERVTVQPGELPPGRYRVRLTIEDQVRRRLLESTYTSFTVQQP
ncbi:MAG: tetratricopeptide repeat protein [Gemmatimonadales bacterium]